jgi:hypothetical protein
MDKQDSVQKGLYLFGQPTTFSKAFPTVADFKITVWIRKGGREDGRPLRQPFTIDNPPGEFIRCPKSDCVNGGWCIGDILREMVSKNETYRKTGGTCTGKQRMNRSATRDCLTDFEADIELVFNSNTSKSAG